MPIDLKNESQSLLTVNNLSLQSTRFDHCQDILSDVSFRIDTGASVGLIGESGSGKTMSALAILDILPAEIQKTGGTICFQGKPVSADQMPTFASLRGKEIAMIFQDAVASLNPVFQVGRQINDVIRCHFSVSQREARDLTLEQFHNVGLPDPRKMYRRYPHELSGGMAQRVMIAMALCCQPKIIIADEPTTALDVKTQLQITHLIKNLQHQHKFGLLLITHDIQLVSNMVDSLLVLHEGKIVERGLIKNIQENPRHSYTRLLFNTALDSHAVKSGSTILLEE
jgi:peptide/nickel transport system ATP-binding protein